MERVRRYTTEVVGVKPRGDIITLGMSELRRRSNIRILVTQQHGYSNTSQSENALIRCQQLRKYLFFKKITNL